MMDASETVDRFMVPGAEVYGSNRGAWYVLELIDHVAKTAINCYEVSFIPTI